MTTTIKYLFIGIVISILAYFLSNHFIQFSTPNNSISFNSLINAMLTWLSVRLFGLKNESNFLFNFCCIIKAGDVNEHVFFCRPAGCTAFFA